MIKGAWLSPVQLLDSALLKVNFDVKTEYSADTPVLSMTVSLQTEHLEKREGLFISRCVFEFSGTWHEPGEVNNIAFIIACSMGITVAIPESSFDADYPKDRINRVVDANAVSLVYGKIRSFIENMTSQSVVGRQIIPAIEPYALLESLGEQSSSVASQKVV